MPKLLPPGVVRRRPATLLVVPIALAMLAACGSTGGLTFGVADDLRAERVEWRGDRSGIVYLRREVRVEIDTAVDPSRAESVVTVRVVRTRYGGEPGLGPRVVLHGPHDAEPPTVVARVVAPQGERPIAWTSLEPGDDATRADPETPTWIAQFDALAPGEILEVLATFVVRGTLVADARALGAPDGRTAELFLRYDMATHVRAAVQLPRGLTRPVVTEKGGRTVIGALFRDLPRFGKDRNVARIVTRRASPKNFDQAFIVGWSDAAAPYTAALVTGSRALRQGHVAPVRPAGEGRAAVEELTRWTRERIQREDATEASYHASRDLPPLLRVNDLNATDKVHLLHWLLDDAGIAHRVAIARRARWPKVAPGFATPGAFDAPILYVPALDMWLDPACRECEPGSVRPDLRGVQALLLPPGEVTLKRLPRRPVTRVAADRPSLDGNPYLLGDYAPVDGEETSGELPVIGELPRDLSGVFVRNGPNPRLRTEGRHHWFDGDGMLHAIRFDRGAATYRNRWVRTAHLARDLEAGRALWRGLLESTRGNPTDSPYKDTSNTDVVMHAGRLLTTCYIPGTPYRVAPESLETEGPDDFGDPRTGRVSAHAKVDAATGELMWFDYGPRPPYMRYGVVDASGRLTHLTPIDLPGPRLPHDMAITARYSVLMDLPVFLRPEALAARRWLIDFHRELPARFGVVPRHGDGASVRWFEADPCYVYHVVHAWEDGDDAIELVGFRQDDPIPAPDPADGDLARPMALLRLRATLHRWRFDLRTGQTTEERLDDRNAEFPAIDARVQGRRGRYAWSATIPPTRTLRFDGVVRHDLERGEQRRFAWGRGRWGSEVAFAPRDGATDEGDGYLIGIVHDTTEGWSECVVLDAAEVEAGPLARVLLPARVPLGFHACWAPATEIPGWVSGGPR